MGRDERFGRRMDAFSAVGGKRSKFTLHELTDVETISRVRIGTSTSGQQ